MRPFNQEHRKNPAQSKEVAYCKVKSGTGGWFQFLQKNTLINQSEPSQLGWTYVALQNVPGAHV